MLEKNLKERDAKGKSKAREGMDGELEEEEREQAVTALVAMIEIWMSDLWYVPLWHVAKSRFDTNQSQYGGSRRRQLR